jgi:PadR family transcriptional regulator, regulatory protein AphA
VPKLTTTSFALLGLLRRGPFSAYELTAHMRRSALAHLWPRTEAGLYREPRNLVEHGLATADEETHGGRKRTVYAITTKGRRALAVWLQEPAAPWQFECEGAVKVFLGDGGDLDAIRAHLEVLAAHKPQEDPSVPDLVTAWLEGRMRFPAQVHYTAMSADLISRLNAALRSWASDWLANTATWTSTDLDAHSEAQAKATLAALSESIAEDA